MLDPESHLYKPLHYLGSAYSQVGAYGIYLVTRVRRTSSRRLIRDARVLGSSSPLAAPISCCSWE